MKSSKQDALAGHIKAYMDKHRIYERLGLPFQAVQVRMTVLVGAQRAAEESKLHAATIILHLLCILAGIAVLVILSGAAMLPAGLIFMALYILYSYKALDNRIKIRRRLIVLELPELLNKLTLLINAGETVHQAIHRCAARASVHEEHPLRREWAKLSRALQDNKPFVIAMEEFSRSCSVLEVSMFSTSVLMNFRRGGSDFAASLQELSHTLWERRKATAKIMGEEASSKLVFPTVLLFLTVMIIVAAPAVLMMN